MNGTISHIKLVFSMLIYDLATYYVVRIIPLSGISTQILKGNTLESMYVSTM